MPFVHLAHSFPSNWAFGLSGYSKWGQKTSWPEMCEGRFAPGGVEAEIIAYGKRPTRISSNPESGPTGMACKKAIRRAKTFRTYLPEASFNLAKLKAVDMQWGHERLRRKDLALAQALGNHLALKRHGDFFDSDAA